ncbi:Fc.00g012060.m01.CDS01 [Cosmosporella sp. VM-42]
MTSSLKKLDKFHPPAFLDDFEGDQLERWSKTVNGWFNSEIAGKVAGTEFYRTKLTQFFNPTTYAFDQSLPPVPITWTGFPLKVRITQPTDDARWAWAEDPANQFGPAGVTPNGEPDRWMMDEYLEWSTKKRKNGDVIIASFTCEGPEYWKELAKYNPIATSEFPARPPNPDPKKKDYGRNDKILNIYKQLNPDFADEIEGDDLVDKNGKYDTFNKWNGLTNTGTIAHLIQINNSLSAEVDIAAQATIARKDLVYGERLTNMITLCGDGSAYGNPSRNSDPTIGAEINTVCRLPVTVSIMDPVALYIHDADFSSFRLDPTGKRRGNVEDMVPVPDGVIDWCGRGNIEDGMGLHLKVRIPKGLKTTDKSRDLNVSDLFDLNNGGQYVRYGSQFSDYITMSVSGVVGPKPKKAPPQWPGRLQPALKYTEPLQPKPIIGPLTHEFPDALYVSKSLVSTQMNAAGDVDRTTTKLQTTMLEDGDPMDLMGMPEPATPSEDELIPISRKIFNETL